MERIDLALAGSHQWGLALARATNLGALDAMEGRRPRTAKQLTALVTVNALVGHARHLRAAYSAGRFHVEATCRDSQPARNHDAPSARREFAKTQQVRAAARARHITVPKTWPVQPLRAGQKAKDRATCSTCGLSWDDGKSTSMTPAPSARCPFEFFHTEARS
jgi:hypothetical protein